MKRILLSMTMMLAVVFAYGQELSKEELKAQKRQIKALTRVVEDAEALISTDPAGAITMLKPAVEHELMQNNAYMWYVLGYAKKGVIDAENYKRSQGQNFDANKMYVYSYEIFGDLGKCYELDMQPDAKGRVKPQYTQAIKKMLYETRPQLYNGGVYFYNEGDYKSAFNQFDMFIESANNPVLAEFDLAGAENSELNNSAAFFSSLSGMRSEDYNAVLKHIDMAVQDSANAETAYQFKVEAEGNTGDTIAWLGTLKDCSIKYAENPYFYQQMFQYYNVNNKTDELMQFVDELIVADPNNNVFYFLKGLVKQQEALELGMGMGEPLKDKKAAKEREEKIKATTDEAIQWYKKSLEIDPEYKSAIKNLGLCYLDKAQRYRNFEASTTMSAANMKKDKAVLDPLYTEARVCFEKLRELYPDEPESWAQDLMNCYYNLKMNKEYNEMEKIVNMM